MKQEPIRGQHVLIPPSLQIAKTSNTTDPSLIVDGKLGVLVFVDGQVLVEQDVSQHLESKV